MKRPSLKATVALVIGGTVLLWMFLRPDKSADLAEVDPVMLAKVPELLPKVKAPVNTVAVKFLTQSDGVEASRKLLAESVSPSVVRKNGKAYTTRNAVAVRQESTGLYIGPVGLIMQTRVPIPIFTDLLPGSFWRTSILRKLDAQPSPDFPWRLGSRFSAIAQYDEYFSSGEKGDPSVLSIDCVAYEQIDANLVHASLRGKAMKVRCEHKSANRKSNVETTERLESWYIEDLQLSLPSLYESTFPGDKYFPAEHELTTRKVLEISVNS